MFDAALVDVDTNFSTFPDVSEELEKVNASPVVKLFAAAFRPDVAPVPVVTVGENVIIVPSLVSVEIPPNVLAPVRY